MTPLAICNLRLDSPRGCALLMAWHPWGDQWMIISRAFFWEENDGKRAKFGETSKILWKKLLWPNYPTTKEVECLQNIRVPKQSTCFEYSTSAQPQMALSPAAMISFSISEVPTKVCWLRFWQKNLVWVHLARDCEVVGAWENKTE